MMDDPGNPKRVQLDAAIQRLLRMRDELLARMVRRGQLPLIATIDAALAVLEDEAPAGESASRAAVSDDGQKVRLTLYAETGSLTAVELDPVRAITLTGKLIGAALPNLA
jgi:hypothetical protein